MPSLDVTTIYVVLFIGTKSPFQQVFLLQVSAAALKLKQQSVGRWCFFAVNAGGWRKEGPARQNTCAWMGATKSASEIGSYQHVRTKSKKQFASHMWFGWEGVWWKRTTEGGDENEVWKRLTCTCEPACRDTFLWDVSSWQILPPTKTYFSSGNRLHVFGICSEAVQTQTERKHALKNNNKKMNV